MNNLKKEKLSKKSLIKSKKEKSSKKSSAKPKRRSSKKRLVKQKKVNSVKKGAGFFDEKKLKEMFLKKSEKNGFVNKIIDKVADKIGIKAYTPPDITITPEMTEYQKLANVMYELILTKRIYTDEYNYNQEYQCVNNTENYTHQYREKCEELMNKVNEIVNEIDKEENTSEKIKNLSAMLEKYKKK